MTQFSFLTKKRQKKSGKGGGNLSFHFSEAQCDQLYDMIMVDDEIHLEVNLPDVLEFDYTSSQLVESFQICHQLWSEGLEEAGFVEILRSLCRFQTLSVEEKALYKKVRAKFKHLCYAYQAFDRRHQKPYWLDRATGFLGKLQDGFKNHKEWIVRPRASFLKMVWNAWGFAFLEQKAADFQPCDLDSFVQNFQKRIAIIKRQIHSGPTLSSYQFHSLRKHVSLFAATFGTFDVLYPSVPHHQLFQYIATINGLMGDFHDQLIERKLNGQQNYYFDHFTMPDVILERLKNLITHFENAKKS